MIASTAAAVAVFGAAAGLGAAALKLTGLTPRSFEERAVSAALVGQPIFALAALGAGVLGFFSREMFWVLLAAGGAAGLAAAPWKDGRFLERAPGRFASGLRVLIGLSVAYALARAAAPVTEKDTLGYHFEAPRQYLAHGAVVQLEANPRAWYPATAQMFWAACLALEGPGAAQVLNVLELVWTALALMVLGRHAFGPQAGLTAAAIFLSLQQSRRLGGTGTDMFFLSFFMAAGLLAVVRAIEEPGLRRFVLGGVALGAAAGTKLPGMAPAAALAVALALFCRRRGMALGTAVPIALLVGGAWYLRLWDYTGNPLFPYLSDLMGTGPYSREGLDRLLAYISESEHDEVNFLYGMTLYRSHWLLAAAALLWWWRPWNRPQAAVAAAWLIGALVWWFTNSQSRFGMPVHGWMAVLAGGGLAAVKVPRLAAAARILALGLVAFHMHHRQFDPVVAGFRIAAGRLDPRAWLAAERPEYPAYAWVNDRSPERPVLLYNSNFLFWRAGPYVTGHPLAQERWKWEACSTAAEFNAMIRTTGAAYVLIETPGLAEKDPARFLQSPVMRTAEAAVFDVSRLR